MTTNARNIKVTAHVKVMIEVSLARPWVGSEVFSTIYETAAREASEIVNIAIRQHDNLRILGEPVASFVVAEKDS